MMGASARGSVVANAIWSSILYTAVGGFSSSELFGTIPNTVIADPFDEKM